MGDSSSNQPPFPLPAEPRTPVAPRPTRHVVLFFLTLTTTTLVGADYYASFISDFGRAPVSLSVWELLVRGLWYSGGVLAILGAHEFGHYFACRWYRVDASLPYFLPLWLPFMLTPGTLGAVIRIRQPIATKTQFFDIGLAGPIAGFVVLIPVMVIGFSLSSVTTLPADFRGFEFGEPLIFQWTGRLFFGALDEGQTLNLHPAGWAAWFGLLATALNLAPVGQLDGGHVSYAVFGRKSSIVTLLVTAAMIGLALTYGGYWLWIILVVAMLLLIGLHHPRAIDEDEPLDRTRLVFAVIAAIMFIVSFTPIPVELIGF